MKLRELGENRLLSRLLPSLGKNKDVVVAAGDDCAVVRPPRGDELLLLKTDCVVEKIHFESSADPARVGWKAMMRPFSDFAAMSGLPQFALVTVIVPATRSTSWVSHLYRGLNRAARKFDVAIVGGETSNTRGNAAVSISVTGYVEKDRFVSRSGGKVGDDLFVTGKLGGSIRGRHLSFVARINESRWLSKNFRVHAMMDLSDGVGADLPRLARASKVGYKIDIDSVPLSPGAKIDNAINDGEDFELLFAISPRERNKLQQGWRKKFPRIPLTRIGSLCPQSAIRNPQSFRGYTHFK
jgi:thiamine-monophosphate kinase